MNEPQDESEVMKAAWHKPTFTRLNVKETAGGVGDDDEGNFSGATS